VKHFYLEGSSAFHKAKECSALRNRVTTLCTVAAGLSDTAFFTCPEASLFSLVLARYVVISWWLHSFGIYPAEPH